jgi:hypothetical protein
MTSDRERQQWTQFIARREREKQPRKPRAKKQRGPTQQEMAAALDDLVGEYKPDSKVKSE